MRERVRVMVQRLLFIVLFSFLYWKSQVLEPFLERLGFSHGSLAQALAIATIAWILASITIRLLR